MRATILLVLAVAWSSLAAPPPLIAQEVGLREATLEVTGMT